VSLPAGSSSAVTPRQTRVSAGSGGRKDPSSSRRTAGNRSGSSPPRELAAAGWCKALGICANRSVHRRSNRSTTWARPCRPPYQAAKTLEVEYRRFGLPPGGLRGRPSSWQSAASISSIVTGALRPSGARSEGHEAIADASDAQDANMVLIGVGSRRRSAS
jgi:hypothetical protein